MAKRWQYKDKTNGGAQVVVDLPDVAGAILEQALELAFPGVVDAMEEEVTEIIENARAAWPVGWHDKPGERSAEALDWALTVDGKNGRVDVRIFDDAVGENGKQYWQFIRAGDHSKNDAQVRGLRPIDELIRLPVKEAKVRLKESFRDVFKRSIKPRDFKFSGTGAA